MFLDMYCCDKIIRFNYFICAFEMFLWPYIEAYESKLRQNYKLKL